MLLIKDKKKYIHLHKYSSPTVELQTVDTCFSSPNPKLPSAYARIITFYYGNADGSEKMCYSNLSVRNKSLYDKFILY